MKKYRTLVILQPTPFCNIDCDYCYLPHRSVTEKMSVDVFGKIAMEVFSSKLVNPPIDFLWHVGEPLAVPKGYYERIFNILKQIGDESEIEYSINFQTNATLINEYWIELIKKYNINIGVSIDGPAFLHDKKRVNKKKQGSHSQVMKGVKMLQNSNIDFNTIMVVTKDSLNYPKEICDFFIANEIYDIGFNIDELEGSNSQSSFSDVTADKYRAFIEHLLKRSINSRGRFKVREFWLNIRSFIVDDTNPLNTTNMPFRIFNFDYKGNYSTYCPELISYPNKEFNNFQMGNILTDGLDSIESNPIFQKIKKEVEAGVESCKKSCEHWSFCGGGAPSNKFFENGTFNSTETLTCKFHKKEIVNLLLNHTEKHFRLN